MTLHHRTFIPLAFVACLSLALGIQLSDEIETRQARAVAEGIAAEKAFLLDASRFLHTEVDGGDAWYIRSPQCASIYPQIRIPSPGGAGGGTIPPPPPPPVAAASKEVQELTRYLYTLDVQRGAGPGCFAYLTDGEHVYYYGGEPPSQRAGSVLGNQWEINDADPRTFHVLDDAAYEGYVYAADKGRIFFRGEPIALDAASFRVVIDHVVADDSGIYLLKDAVTLEPIFTEADPSTFEIISPTYAKDAHNVFRDGSVVPGVDSETFVILDEEYVRDKEHVYFQGRVIGGADPATFAVLGDLGYVFGYAKDAQHVYFEGMPVEWADPETFQYLGVKYYFKDSDSVWYHETESGVGEPLLLPGLRPDAFAPLPPALDTSGWLTYANERYGYEVQYPPGTAYYITEVEEGEAQGVRFALEDVLGVTYEVPTEEGLVPEDRFAITVRVLPVVPGTTVKQATADLRRAPDLPHPYRTTDTVLGREPAVLFEFDGDPYIPVYPPLVIYAVHDDYLYEFSGITLPRLGTSALNRNPATEVLSRYEPIYRLMRSHFRFLNEPEGNGVPPPPPMPVPGF